LTLELGFLSRRESAARVASRADARATHAGLAHARDIAPGKVVGRRAISQIYPHDRMQRVALPSADARPSARV